MTIYERHKQDPRQNYHFVELSLHYLMVTALLQNALVLVKFHSKCQFEKKEKRKNEWKCNLEDALISFAFFKNWYNGEKRQWYPPIEN